MANLSVGQKLLPYLADELGFLVVQELSRVPLCDPVDCSMPGVSPSPPSRVCSNSCPSGLDRFSIYLCLSTIFLIIYEIIKISGQAENPG